MCRVFLVLLCLTILSGCSAPSRPPNLHDTLQSFHQDCGFSVAIPLSRRELELAINRNTVTSSFVPNPPTGQTSDTTFPLRSRTEIVHGAIIGAVVVRCSRGQAGSGTVLGSKTPVYVFYVDDTGRVFHVEDHSIFTG